MGVRQHGSTDVDFGRQPGIRNDANEYSVPPGHDFHFERGIAGIVLMAGGATAIGGILLGMVGIVAIPLLAFGYASPRAGLLWQGSYAEPWRSDRSPGEWSSIEAGRFDRDVRNRPSVDEPS